jgi:hypothetical protein
MNETPEASPPAFPSAEPAEATGPAGEAPGRSPRSHRQGSPKLSDAWPEPLAEAPPAHLAEAWPGRLAVALHRVLRGTWRVAVAEESMTPALAPGDWLFLDPTLRHWPRRGSIVVFREPDSGILAIKRVAAGPGDRVRLSAGLLHLASDEAWLLGDNAAVSLDSRRYGPVPLEALVGRAWFRYGPLARVGPFR